MKQEDLKFIESNHVWLGSVIATQKDKWTYYLNSDDLLEIDAAIESVTAQNLDLLKITKFHFLLPNLYKKIEAIERNLQHGLGFAIIRGFPIKKYNIQEIATAYFGIGSYLGEAVSQNARGHALGHVCNLGFDPSLPTARGYQSSNKLNYHTDPTDLVGLMCIQKAKSGGLSSIISSGTVYNKMLKQRPDLVHVLTKTLYRDRRGEIPEGRKPWYRLPVFNFHNGNLTTNYVRSTIEKAQRFLEIPRLTNIQKEAFSLIEEIAADPSLAVNIEFEPGDIQFLNNHYIMHSRTGYEDYPGKENRRHLLRLWLASAAAPPLAPPYYEFMDKTISGRPNGYHMPGVVLSAPLDVEDGGPGKSQQRISTGLNS